MSAPLRRSNAHGERVVEALACGASARDRRASTRTSARSSPPIATRSCALVERQARSPIVVKASEEDLEWLYPGRAVEETLAAWARRPAASRRDARRTRRGRLSRQERIEVAPRLVDVVDTVGAGDSFMSALLFAMERDGALGADAPAPARGGSSAGSISPPCASAITCTRKGSDPPTLAEVEAALG